MEFLRFGSSIPGSYWGCCACCIIQNFNVDPDAKASIQLVDGDGGAAVIGAGGAGLFAGPTYRDIFHQRIRSGTFEKRDMPNHAFLAILSKSQLSQTHGKAWLAILKEAGFEFIRTVNNSVWDVDNYVFGLFRNVGSNSVKDQFTPPKAWTDIESVKTETWTTLNVSGVELTAKQKSEDKAVYDKIGPPKFLTEKEIVAAGAPVILAGKRSKYPQQTKQQREQIEAAEAKTRAAPAKTSAFPYAAPPNAATG